MAELLRILLELIDRLSPFHKVREWEQGCYYLAGCYLGTVGRGTWPVVPWLCDVLTVSMVPSIHKTSLQTITLRNKEVLTFSATVRLRVDDANLAMNAVEHWPDATMELVSALLADQLADVDPDRVDPARGKRDRLLVELAEEADAETRKFGVRVESIHFPNFVRNVKTLRLLTEPAAHALKP